MAKANFMSKIICLLVSPLAADRLLVEEALERGFCDFQVTQVADASSWQEALAAGDYSLGIIAETLPWAETAAVVRGLKTLRPECPVIMLAAPEREEAAWEALLSGIDDYVLKSPEEMRRLPGVIRAARYRARRLAGEPFRTGAADFKVLFDAVPEVVFVHDPETGNILDANQEACHRLGYSREEFKNLHIDAISLGEPPFNREEALRGIRKTVQEGPQSLEWLGRTKAGKPIWIEINSKRVVIGGQERVLSFGRNISRHKQVQEALRETETRYETLLDNAGDAIFIHDTAGRLLQVNDAACKLLGYSRAELQQMSLKDLDAPTRPGIREKIRESRRQGHVFVETALKRRDGAAVPVELSSRFVEYAGLPVAFSIARDMTERKEAEEKLRQSEIMYRSIFETTGTATCIDDENTILRLVNDECAKLTGYTREELEGKKSWTEFIVPEDLERLKGYHLLRRQDSDAAPKIYTLRWQDRQGRIRDMLATIALIPGTKNSVASLLDITARQQVEKALRESEVRYRLLVETMNDGLGMQDENGNITFVNRRLCEILGYAKEELLGRYSGDFLDAANRDILKEQMDRRKKGQNQAYEMAWIRKDGTKVHTGISPVPMFDAAGKFQGSFAVIADLSRRQQAKRALLASEEKYRAIFENTGNATAIVEADNTISLVNAEFVKLSGYSREEVEGKKKWMEFAAVADQPMMKEYHRQRRLEPPQAPRNYEARFVDRQGEVKDMLVTAGMIPGTNKSVGSLLDITARKKAEQDLLLERKKFQILTENSPFALVMIGKDGTFKYLNPKFSELFGYTLADVPDGKTWFRKAYPDPAYRHQVISAWVNDLERYRPRENMPRTFTVTCKDGAEKIISFISLQLDDGDQLTTCEDITERHLAEEAVKRSEERFRLLMENSMVHLGIIDAEGTILYENPTMERLLGYDIGELEGKNSFELTHPEDQARSQEVMRKLLESPGTVFSAEVRYRHQDGSWRFLEVKAKNLLNEPIIRGIVVSAQDITMRKEALEALEQSEERYRAIVEDQTELVTRFLPDGTFTFVNETLCRFFGKSREEMIGINFYPFLPDEEKAVVRKNLAALDRDNPISTHEYPVFMPDGQVTWHQWTTRAIFDNQGRIIEFQGVGQDITERKRAEEALRQAEAEKSLILKNMSEMVTYRDRDNRILWANPAAAARVGLLPEQMVGRFCYEVLHQRHTLCPDCLVIESLNSGQMMETEIIKPDGKVFFLRSSPVKDEKGEVQGTVLVASDITARKKAEEGLKASEEKMRLVIETSPVGIRISQQGRHIYVNPALVRMFGYGAAGEIVGWPVGLLFAPGESAIPPQKMTTSPPGKPGPSSYEALGLKEDGARIEVQVWQTGIDYQGEPALLDFVLDISEAKALRSQLLQSQKMEAIGTLAGGIAHDFNNILLPILINAEMVQEGLPPDSPFRQKLARIIKACQRAIDLVKQILAFSRHEERKLSPVRLAAIIQDSLRLLRSTLPATIEITQHLECDIDTVLADPTQIQQVLINLCTNAAHALGDRGGVIDINLKEVEAGTAKVSRPQELAPGPYLQLTVRDNGAGMDSATRERIFDPYFTTKKPEEGTGLGLAVVHGIVKKHGGVISVESELGKGTLFHLLLPRVEAEAIPETGGFMPLPQGWERILLVDNDSEIVATLQQLMEHLGYQVVALTDSVEALNSFRADPQDFDLVITDQTMPKLTGEDLAREILGLRPDIPIILCTGFSEAVSPEKARAMGIRELIIKPIATRVMAETIRRVLAHKHNLN